MVDRLRPEVNGRSTPRADRPSQYLTSGGSLCRVSLLRDEPQSIPLANFTARIVADVLHDDGAEQRRVFRVEGRLASGTPLPEIDIPADQFDDMKWVTRLWSCGAVVYVGPKTRDHCRAAIQMLSGEAAREVVYAHTGWRQVGDEWVYLHAGGVIGRDGPVPGVTVAPPGTLARFDLPDPPTGERLRAAVRASLGLLDGLAPDAVMIPLLVAAYRAPLGGADYSVGLFGMTGLGKSELAALAQQHFGVGFDARNLPGNWTSTANATEGLMFAAKDALLVIDDYNPDGADPNALRRQADRVLRGPGNGSGRQRMNPDGTLKPDKPPRSLNLLTGEAVPGGASARARMWTVEIKAGNVSFSRLSGCQRDAAAGLYAEAMAGYLRWLAGDFRGRKAALKADVGRLRADLGRDGGHARTPSAGADLLAGLNVLLDFAASCGAVTSDEADVIRGRGVKAVRATAAAQDEHIKEADPVERFMSLIRSVLSSGRAHLTGREGRHPDRCQQAAGWRPDGQSWRESGRRIGWLVDDGVFLDPASALAEAVKMAADQGGSPLNLTTRDLGQKLDNAGLLVATEQRCNKKRFAVRKWFGGVGATCFYLRADLFFPPATEQPPDPEADLPD